MGERDRRGEMVVMCWGKYHLATEGLNGIRNCLELIPF